MLFLQQTVAHGGAGEHHGHKGKPQQMRGGHKRAVADLNAQRRGGADDLGEGAEHKQRGFRVERIGGQAVFKGRPIADGLPAGLHCGRYGAVAESGVADIHQISRTQEFHRVEKIGRLQQQNAHAQKRVAHVYPHCGGNADGGENAGAAAVKIAVARDHGEIAAGADNGKQGDGGNGEKLLHGRGPLGVDFVGERQVAVCTSRSHQVAVGRILEADICHRPDVYSANKPQQSRGQSLRYKLNMF